MLILVVDDDADIVDLLSEFLTMKGYTVDVALNGSLAFEQIQHHCPTAILSDTTMPVMGGIDLCRQLSQDDHYRTIPVILMSAGVRPRELNEFPKIAFIHKPFVLAELYTLLEHVITNP